MRSRIKRKKWSKKWKASKKPVKQRKYRKNIPKHLAKKLFSIHLSKELGKKYLTRNLPARKGDTVKIMRGGFKKKEGKLNRVDYSRKRVYIEGIEVTKRDGSKAFVGVQPSNLMLVELNLDDKKRLKKLTKKSGEKNGKKTS